MMPALAAVSAVAGRCLVVACIALAVSLLTLLFGVGRVLSLHFKASQRLRRRQNGELEP